MVKCAYCGSLGPFNAEHVFPYSLGGGGQGWTLDCVCEDCNNTFSSIDRALARSSLDSLSRTQYGPEGRSSGKQLRKVPLYADGIYLYSDGLIYEAGIELGLQPYLRAQLIEVHPEMIQFTGSRSEELSLLLQRINGWREKDFAMTIAAPVVKGDPFRAIRLSMENGKVNISGESESRKPVGMWLETYEADESDGHFSPRLFIDDEARLVLRARSVDEAISFLGPVLTYLDRNHSALHERTLTEDPGVPVLAPRVRVNLVMKPVHIARAITKIGLNLMLKLYGPDFLEDPAFDSAKAFVRGEIDTNMGEEERHVRLIGDQPSPFDHLPVTSDKHWMFLIYHQNGGLIFGLKLYGIGGYLCFLGDKPLPIGTSSLQVVTIDYLTRSAHLLSPSEMREHFKHKAD